MCAKLFENVCNVLNKAEEDFILYSADIGNTTKYYSSKDEFLKVMAKLRLSCNDIRNKFFTYSVGVEVSPKFCYNITDLNVLVVGSISCYNYDTSIDCFLDLDLSFETQRIVGAKSIVQKILQRYIDNSNIKTLCKVEVTGMSFAIYPTRFFILKCCVPI